MSDLKPCMCCGKSNRVTIYSTFCYANEEIRNIRFGVKCNRCGIELGTYSKKETAIKRWNTRPAEDAKDKEIKGLKAKLEDALDFLSGVAEDVDANGMRSFANRIDKKIKELKEQKND